MFCQGFDNEGKCRAQPELGVVHGDKMDLCEECGEKGIGKCKFAKHGRDREGCSCYFVDCQNPACMVYGIIGPQISSYCSGKYCSHFELGH